MSDQLIDKYVRELRTAAWVRQLPTERTAALESETRARIAADVAATGKSGDDTVREVLLRMGPADDIVAAADGAVAGDGSVTLARAMSPFDQLRLSLAIHGWGLAEIAGLLLLIAGPFLLWWVAPVLGIILIRYTAERWSVRAMRKATTIIFGLLALQAALSIGLLLYVLATGGSLADQLQWIMSTVGPGGITGARPPIGTAVEPDLVVVVTTLGGLLAPAAGVISGIYLMLSPRVGR